MSEQEPGPSQNPYGQPTNPYGQQSSTPKPYGQAYGEQQARKGNMKDQTRDLQKKFLPQAENSMPRNPFTGGPG